MQPKNKPARSGRATAFGVTGIVLACVGAAAMVMTDRSTAPEAALAPVQAAPTPAIVAEPPAPEPVAAPKPAAPKAVRPKAATRTAGSAAVATTKTAARTPASTTMAEPKTIAARKETATADPGEYAIAPKAHTAESMVRSVEPEVPPVTITGCLELNDDTYRLKNTSGVDAPRSRSWKSGFLRKGSATIQIVDAAGGVNLPSHVGMRISASGTLIDRAMQVRSVQRVAASCD